MHAVKSQQYIDELEKMMYAYNMSPHSSLLGLIFFDVYLLHDLKEIHTLLAEMYITRRGKIKLPGTRVKVGAYLRLQSSDSSIVTFRKGHEVKFTRVFFCISRINTNHYPPTYEITPLDTDEPIKRFAYKQELVECDGPDVYTINVL